MLSAQAAYTELIRSQRDKSIDQARKAYFAHTQSLKKHHQNIRSNSNKIRALQPQKIATIARSKSIKTIFTIGKKRVLKTNPNQNSNTSKKNIELTDDSNHQESVRKNKEGQNCRICILKRGVVVRQTFKQVKDLSEIRQFLKEQKFFNYNIVPKQISLDLAIAHSKICGKFLNGQTLYLKAENNLHFVSSSQISLAYFQIIQPIGSGGFSQVYLARSKINSKFYALKVIQKQMVIRTKREKLVMNERNILVNCHHPFIVELSFAFETEKYLIFAMEFCEGGELFGLIKKYKKLEEKTAKFYIIEILLGLQHLHNQNVVYRDIKPQNILIGADGHVKIADLGLAKPRMNENKLTHSFCGSPEYMSPEMIKKIGHTYPVDYYCLGALLFQLVTGLPPFYSQNADEIYKAVLEQEVKFPENLSQQCKNLIQSLLCKDPKKRLGSIYGIKQILVHPWFGKQNFDKYLNKQVKPPVKFSSIKQYISIFDHKLNEKKQNILDGFLKDIKKEQHTFKPLFDQFKYTDEKQITVMEEEKSIGKNYHGFSKRRSEKSAKIPHIPNSNLYKFKENSYQDLNGIKKYSAKRENTVAI